jgi:hypothetical protein
MVIYPRKLGSIWTNLFEPLPRWIDLQDEKQYVTSVTLPERGGAILVGDTPTYTFSSLSSSWYLTSSTLTTSNFFSGILNSFSNEFHNQYTDIQDIFYSLGGRWSFATPGFLWIAGTEKVPNQVSVLVDNENYQEIPRVDSLWEALQQPWWCWYWEDSTLVLFNLDTVESLPNISPQSWAYMTSAMNWSYSGPTWVKHPKTLKWIKTSPNKIHPDGFIGYNTSQTPIRHGKLERQLGLQSLSIQIDGAPAEVTRVKFWGQSDDYGLMWGHERLENENPYIFQNRVSLASKYSWANNTKSLESWLSSRFGLGYEATITNVALSGSFNSNEVGLHSKNYQYEIYPSIAFKDDSLSFIDFFSGSEHSSYNLRDEWVKTTLSSGAILVKSDEEMLDTLHLVKTYQESSQYQINSAPMWQRNNEVFIIKGVSVQTGYVSSRKESLFSNSIVWRRRGVESSYKLKSRSELF